MVSFKIKVRFKARYMFINPNVKIKMNYTKVAKEKNIDQVILIKNKMNTFFCY